MRWQRDPTGDPDDPELYRASLVEHIDELRSRIIKSVLFIAGGWAIGWVAAKPIYDWLNVWAKSQVPKTVQFHEVFRNVTDPFLVKMRVSFYIGLILVFPFIVNQLWGFIRPGLTARERKPLRTIVPAGAALFLLGASLSWVVLPMAIRWFCSYVEEFPGTEGVLQEPGWLVFFVLKMMLAFGMGFQLPLVVIFLVRIGLLTPEGLVENWRQATVGIFTLSMILTPSNDVPSMLTMAVPMTLLFYGSIIAVKKMAPPVEVIEDLGAAELKGD